MAQEKANLIQNHVESKCALFPQQAGQILIVSILFEMAPKDVLLSINHIYHYSASSSPSFCLLPSFLTLSSYCACFSAFFRQSYSFFPFKLLMASSSPRAELLWSCIDLPLGVALPFSITLSVKESSVVSAWVMRCLRARIMQLTIITFSIDFLITMSLKLHQGLCTCCRS